MAHSPVTRGAWPGDDGGDGDRTERRLAIVSTVLLALATVATAWAGYQASRWHGEQAQAQTRATAARLESTRASGVANREIQIDVAVFIQWVDAHAQGDTALKDFYEERFSDRLRPAFDAWIATMPFDNDEPPKSPFAMPQYRLASSDEAERLETDADAASEEAREDIERAALVVIATPRPRRMRAPASASRDSAIALNLATPTVYRTIRGESLGVEHTGNKLREVPPNLVRMLEVRGVYLAVGKAQAR